MLTDLQIQALLSSEKKITKKSPPKGYKQEDNHRRCDLSMTSASSEGQVFSVFIRQNIQFEENFSIGLRYKTESRELGTITLIRYNGAHGEKSHSEDGHYNKPHIHRLVLGEMAPGSNQPQESQRESTDRYHTFEDALLVFFEDMNITNWLEYFSNIKQRKLF